MKWWLQSFLVDTKQLLIGMRDDSGIVHKLINFVQLKNNITDDIPQPRMIPSETVTEDDIIKNILSI